MRENAGENLGREAEAFQELQPVDGSRIPAHLELAEPYEARELPGYLFGRKCIETRAYGVVETNADAGLDPALGDDNRIGAALLDDRRGR